MEGVVIHSEEFIMPKHSERLIGGKTYHTYDHYHATDVILHNRHDTDGSFIAANEELR